MKNSLEKPGGEQAEQRRAEQDADDDLAYRGRLAHALREFTAEAGGQDDQRQLSVAAG